MASLGKEFGAPQKQVTGRVAGLSLTTYLNGSSNRRARSLRASAMSSSRVSVVLILTS